MTRLTLSQRIAAVGLLILLTVSAALIYFIQEGFSKDIAFAAQEQRGNAYERPLVDLLRLAGEHQLLMRRSQPAGSVAAQIDASLGELKAVDAKLGAALEFTPEGLAKRKRNDAHWEVLQSEWDSLKKASGKSPGEIDKLHEQLIANVRLMIAHAGDTSNLILDSDLDSYYLMDGTLVTLPQTEDRLASLEKLGQDNLTKATLSEDDRRSFAVAGALLGEADRDRMAGDAQTALNEDRNFHGVSPSLQRNLTPATDAYLKANKELLELLTTISSVSGKRVSEARYAEAVHKVRAASFELSRVGMDELDVLLRMRIEDLSRARLIALGLTALALLISTLVAAGVIRSISRSLQRMSEELLRQSEQIASSSSELAIASQGLADGASRQAASLEETSASTEQISAMAAKNTLHSDAAAALVAESQQRVEASNVLLQCMVESMDGIADGSQKISRIIKVIDEIAFQTNILALNAAVEAARAGSSGAGFAVVAEEVRNLSQRCAQAASDTNDLIRDSNARTVEGRARVDLVVSAIELVRADSVELKKLVEQVSVGSSEQTRGIHLMAQALSQMDGVTQANAASAQQGATSVESLKGHADALLDIVADVSLLAG